MEKINDKELELIREEKENKIFYEKLNDIKNIEGVEFNYFYKSNAEELYEFKLKDNLYKLTILYNKIETKVETSRVFNVKYIFKSDEEYKTDFHIIIKKACECCDREEIEIVFPVGEDINHYIIVTELNDIIKDNK